jgi:hypothetical protein
MVSGSGVVALAIALLVGAYPNRVKLEEARSMIAEASQIEQLAAAGKLTAAYAHALRGDLRKGLTSLQKEPALAADVGAALEAMDRKDAAGLRAIADKLAGEERDLGRAG